MENPDRDVQMTLRFEDGHEQSFTVIRDSDMRWRGYETHGALVAIEAKWFNNPPTQPQEEVQEVKV